MPGETEADDRYSQLEAAFEAAQAPANEQAEVPANEDEETPEPAAAETQAPSNEADSDSQPEKTAAERARDESGRFAKKESKQPEAPAKAAPPATKAKAPAVSATPAQSAATTGTHPGTEGQTSASSLRAPQSWTPAAREEWTKVPASIQAEIHRREREAKTAIDQSAPARDFYGQWQQVAAPYQRTIQASGLPPHQLMANLLQAQATLTEGNADQFARGVANLINSRRDVPVDLISSYLGGAPSPQGPQAQGGQPPQSFDPNQFAAQVEQRMMEKLQAQAAQRQQERQAKELADFAAKNEFFGDVRQDMAILIESAARRGVEMTPQQAYDKACKMDEKISQILAQRAEAQRANAPNASTQRAKAAASSVRSTPGPAASAADSDDRRAQLEAAFEQFSGR